MTFTRYAPLSLLAAFGVAFASVCGEEPSVADGATATTTHAPHPAGPIGWRATRVSIRLDSRRRFHD
jgi:hypothetical protein